MERTHPERVAESVRIDGLLVAAGLNSKPYKNPPQYSGSHVAVVTLAERTNILRVWPGNAEIDIKTNKRFRQAVITLTEKERVITRTYSNRMWVGSGRNAEAYAAGRAQQFFPISLPETAVYSTDSETVKQDSEYPDYYLTTWTVTASVPESIQSLLVGYDEDHQFVSMLPSPVANVKAAHDLLRPEGVPDDALRQGEWFFVPATTTEQKTVESRMMSHFRPEVSSLGYRSTHRCLNVDLSATTFAIGPVIETRDRHKTLHLNGWHRVVRNTELEDSQNIHGQRNYD